MPSFNDDAAASRARMAEFDRERNRDRASSDRRDRRTRRRADYDRQRGTGSRSPEARLRIAEIHARQPGDPRGTIAEPLPMGPYKSPRRLGTV